MPVLTVIYPVALVLIVMGISHDRLNYSKLTYQVAAFISVVLPFIDMLYHTFNLRLPLLTQLGASMPLANKGLSWLVPTLLAVMLVTLVQKLLAVFNHVPAVEEL